MEKLTPEILAISVSVIGTIFSWFIADAKAKAKVVFLDDKIQSIEKIAPQVTTLEIRMSRSEEDRSDIHKLLERLDGSKASKEAVEGFRQEIGIFRNDMYQRFDRIERILESEARHNRGLT